MHPVLVVRLARSQLDIGAGLTWSNVRSFPPQIDWIGSNINQYVTIQASAAARGRAAADDTRRFTVMRSPCSTSRPAGRGAAKSSPPPNPIDYRPGIMMTPTGIFDHRVGKLWALSRFCVQGVPYGGLIGTVTDAARFLALRVDPQAHPNVLSEDAVLAMQQTTAHGRKLDVGLGWFRRRSDPPGAGPYWEHLGGGGGFFNTMRVYPELKLGLVAMGNATNWDHLRLVQAATQSGD